jgi:vacuolar-type H+-ATPase subunit H
MQNVVDEVLKVEAEAEKIVDLAKEKAHTIKQQIESEVNMHIAQAREQAKEIIQKKIAQAKKKALDEYNKALADAEAKSEEFWEKNQDKVDVVVDKLVDFLVTPEFERE